METPIRRLAIAAYAFAIGLGVFWISRVATGELDRTIFYELFDGFASSYTDKFLGERFLHAHIYFVCGIAAFTHGVFFAAVASTSALFVPRLNRFRAAALLTFLTIVDLGLMVFLFRDPEGWKYFQWLYY